MRVLDRYIVWTVVGASAMVMAVLLTLLALFLFIGADPCTGWLPPSIARDPWGYVETGAHCEGATCGTDNDGCTPAPT